MNTLFNNSSPIVLSGQPVTNGAYEFFSEFLAALQASGH